MTYVAHPEGTLWRSRAEGSEKLQLTLPPMVANLPRWSPDAKRIAFQASGPGKSWATYVIRADGGNPEEIEPWPGDPGWSADGKSLVFSSEPAWFHPGSSRPSTIQIMDLKTRQVSTLPGSEGLYSPRWSPDGRYIAALRAGPETLWVCDLSERKWTEMEKIAAGYPSWSHDSEYVYFDSAEREPAFYRVRMSDRKLERVANLKGVPRTGSSIATWSGLTPDDSPLVLREVGAREIYALDVQFP